LSPNSSLLPAQLTLVLGLYVQSGDIVVLCTGYIVSQSDNYGSIDSVSDSYGSIDSVSDSYGSIVRGELPL
jgi:hypothetical protein